MTIQGNQRPKTKDQRLKRQKIEDRKNRHSELVSESHD